MSTETQVIIWSQEVTVNGNKTFMVTTRVVLDSQGNVVSSTSESVPIAQRTIKAPLAGVFWPSSGSGQPPLVQIGDKVEIGQEVCLIEAMKVFNAVHAGWSGTVVAIHAKAGEAEQ